MRRPAILLLCVVLLSIVVFRVFTQADETDSPTADSKAEQDTSQVESPPAPEAAPNPSRNGNNMFQIPEGTDENDLQLFLRKMARSEPPNRSEQGIAKFLSDMDAAAQEVAARDVSDDVRKLAYQIRIEVLEMLPQFGDSLAMLRRTKLIDDLKRDDSETIRDFAAELLFDERIRRAPVLTAEAKSKLVEDLVAMLSEQDFAASDELPWQLGSAVMLGQTFERFGDEEHAALAYREFVPVLKGKSHPKYNDDLEQLVTMMESRLRRMSLPGKEIEIAGPTLDGGTYDIRDHRGKVVLVDFWATWCATCLQEMPNVKNLYELYHEQGFEVVGVNLDEDPVSVQQFLRVNHLPWPTIFENGGQNPLAEKYGISVLPQTFLVDREGKVVATQVMGRKLAEELEKLLGPVDSAPAPAPPAPVDDSQ